MRSDRGLAVALGCFFALLFGGAAVLGLVVFLGAFRARPRPSSPPVVPLIPSAPIGVQPVPQVPSLAPPGARRTALVIGDAADVASFACVLGMDGWATVTAGFDELAPPIAGYHAIVILRGNHYLESMSEESQRAIVNAVENGVGLVVDEWFGYYATTRTPILEPLLPNTAATYVSGETSYQIVRSDHPVVQGLPASFALPSHSRGVGTTRRDGEALMKDSEGNAVVIAGTARAGRVVWFGAADHYSSFDWLESRELTAAFAHALGWASRTDPATGSTFDMNAAAVACRGR